MKSFRQHLREDDLSIIKHHVKNDHIGMLSASRSEFTPAENATRTHRLKVDLQQRGVKHISVKGRYIENYGKPNAKAVDEDSFFVHGDHNLLGHLKELGNKYNQDSILHKAPEHHYAKLHGTNETGYPGMGKAENIGSFHPNQKGEMYSVTKNGSHFAFAA